jgi:SHS family lactate transporter-like MFS transporter
MLRQLRSLTPNQRSAVVASYLGWTLDAFDFFILVFVLKDVAQEFGAGVTATATAISLTLAARPIGALIFGLAADRYGRRVALMASILMFSALEFLSGLAPNLTIFLILRFAFGVAMGGEWGVGAALAMETIPPPARGLVSGVLQNGYPSGYLLATLVYFLLYGLIGWRGMFMAGALPALLTIYVRSQVEESPAFLAGAAGRGKTSLMPWSHIAALRANAGRFAYAVLLMTAFNFLSHGTQDLYPTFLQLQHHLPQHMVGLIAVIYNCGAILGGILFGALSQRIGRRRAIIIAVLLVLPLIPAWAYGSGPVMLAAGACLMQLAVQGAWGVVPAYLNELSPGEVRGTFPGLAYQLGNLLASANANLQAAIAQAGGGDYAFALAAVTAIVAAALLTLTAFGPEAHGARLGAAPSQSKEG